MKINIYTFCFYLTVLFCSISKNTIAQTTYTTVAAGSWSANSSWVGGIVPPNPLPANDIINVQHVLTMDAPRTINGILNWHTEGAYIDINQPLNGTGSLRFFAKTIHINNSITLSDVGNLSLTASANITIDNTTTTLSVVNGNLTMNANQQAETTDGAFVGIEVNGATVKSTGTGIVSLIGKGGNSSFNQIGIVVRNFATVEGGASGITLLRGTGGPSIYHQNFGIRITTSRVSSIGSDVQITGVGGGTGASVGDIGTVVELRAAIVSGGNGAVNIKGTGGLGTGGRDYGVFIGFESFVSSQGMGDITIEGEGGKCLENSNHGIFIKDSNTQITSNGGHVLIIGKGGGTGSSSENMGIRIQEKAVVSAGRTASLTIQGTGGLTSGFKNHGISIAHPESMITSSGGNVRVIGKGGGSDTSGLNNGVRIESLATITARGDGSVTVVGTGGFGSGNKNDGVYVADTAVVTSGGGNIQITGIEGEGASLGFALSNALVTTAQHGGTISIFSNKVKLETPNSVCINSPNSVFLRPYTQNTSINLGSETNMTPNTLELSEAELDLIMTNRLNIGDINSGSILVSKTISPVSYKMLALGNHVQFLNTGGFVSTIGSDMTDFSKIEIAGVVALSGTLGVEVFKDLMPSNGQNFNILTANYVNGTFSNAHFPTPSCSTWSTNYAATTVTVNARMTETPSVTMTLPTIAETFRTDVLLAATATGSIHYVNFFLVQEDGSSGVLTRTLLDKDSTAPYSFVWKNITAGTYKVQSEVVTYCESKAYSPIALVNVLETFRIQLTSPTPRKGYVSVPSLNLTASISAFTNRTITKVAFFNGTTKLGEDNSEPYNYRWNNAPIGNFSITVKVTDNTGAVWQSPINNFVGKVALEYAVERNVLNPFSDNTIRHVSPNPAQNHVLFNPRL